PTYMQALHPPVTPRLSLHDALPISRRRYAAQTFRSVSRARPEACTTSNDLVAAPVLHAGAGDRRRTLIGRIASVHVTRATRAATDRKSTRLNSSHLGISYAVFCLKK